MSSRNILYVIGSLGTGGAERHLQIIMPFLVSNGWNVSVYCLSSSGELASKIENSGIRIISPNRNNYKYDNSFGRCLNLGLVIVKLWFYLIRNRQDIIHFFLPEAYLLGAPVAILAGIKYRIMSRRSLDHYQKRYPGLKTIESHLHKYMSVILGNSKAVINELVQEKVPKERLRLIYNGVKISEQEYDLIAIRASLGLKEDSLVFVVVANLIPYKGHADLIDALGLIHHDLPEDWTLLLIGRDDGIKESLLQQAKDLGVDLNIEWLGLREDVEKLLHISDIGILCSWQEGFSNSILEGMEAGLPLIVTDVGGNPEAVVNNETGIVVPPHQPEKLAEAIMCLANDKQLRIKMGMLGRKRVDTYFSLKLCVNKYEKLYDALLNNKKLPVYDNEYTRSTVS